MKEVLTTNFWRRVRKTFKDALEGQPSIAEGAEESASMKEDTSPAAEASLAEPSAHEVPPPSIH